MKPATLNAPDALPKTKDRERIVTDDDTSWIKKLGPGLVTGAADDDPSGIATYSQTGAQFGYGLLWSMLFTYPLMVAIQLVSARIGRVSGHGLATNIRHHYPAWILYSVVTMLVVANTLNIAADMAAMGEAVYLMIGGKVHLYVVLLGLLSATLQVFVPYTRYVRVLKWLTLALLAYVATAFAIQLPWAEVIHRTLVPSFSAKREYITALVAVFGTTISPYLFFWQASQEVEELNADPKAMPLKRAIWQARGALGRVKLDTQIGMAFSNAVAFFIMLTTAATLNAKGITSISTSADAANALRPIAGDFAFLLFSLGIIGTGLLAVPVLAGSAAYAMAGAFRWRNSLEDSPSTAKRFYAVIVLATLGGVALGFSPINPIRALYWSAVINGIMAVPIMVITMLMASRKDIMGPLVVRSWLKALGWLCTAVMALVVVAFFVA